MTLVPSIFLFILGLIIGSAINALAYRIKVKKKFTKGRSFCPHCKHTLGPLDLIPVVSYLMQKGKCRYCKKKIGIHYPLIELLTAFSFTGFYLFSGIIDPDIFATSDDLYKLIFGLVYISFLVFIILYDAKNLLILDVVVYPLIIIAFLGSWVVFQTPLDEILMGGAVGFGFFALMHLMSRGKWIGMGDLKLGLALGLMFGLWLFLVCLFFAYIFGAAISILMLARKKKKVGDKIPFGPFLAGAAIFTLIIGPHILNWYIKFL
ncbi:prepilin peptidase [Patescibacteria group bacterium]